MRRPLTILTSLFLFTLSACTSTGSLGIVTKPASDNASILKSGRNIEEVGITQGESCRFFLIAVVPWGNGTFSDAVNQALAEKGGDALINVTVSTSLYGFIPIYNVFSYTCTKVEGIAVKFK